MGKGVILPSADQAQAIASNLNTMFSEPYFEATKARYHALKAHYPALLEHKAGEAGTSRRQRTLRHAGWLLTADVDFGAALSGTALYPAKKFRLWLRWLTWVEQHQQPNSTVTIDGQTTTRETPAQAIKETLRQAFNKPNNAPDGISVTFTWLPPAATETELVVVVLRTAPQYSIVVKSRSVEDISGLPDADDDDKL